MPRRRTKRGIRWNFLLLGVFFILIIFERISVYYLVPENKLVQLSWLDKLWVFGILALFALSRTRGGKGLLINTLGEDRSPGEILENSLWGILAGIFFTFLAFSGFLSVITTAVAGDYQPLSTLGKLQTIRQDLFRELDVGDISPAEHFLLVATMETLHVSFSEEVAMLGAMAFFASAFGVLFVRDSYIELFHPFTPIVLLLRGIFFGFLHYWAYAGSLAAINLAYFIPAVFGGIFFGTVVFVWGIVSAIFAHGTYNTLVAYYQATGGFPIATILLVVLVCISGIITLRRLRVRTGRKRGAALGVVRL